MHLELQKGNWQNYDENRHIHQKLKILRCFYQKLVDQGNSIRKIGLHNDIKKPGILYIRKHILNTENYREANKLETNNKKIVNKAPYVWEFKNALLNNSLGTEK